MIVGNNAMAMPTAGGPRRLAGLGAVAIPSSESGSTSVDWVQQPIRTASLAASEITAAVDRNRGELGTTVTQRDCVESPMNAANKSKVLRHIAAKAILHTLGGTLGSSVTMVDLTAGRQKVVMSTAERAAVIARANTHAGLRDGLRSAMGNNTSLWMNEVRRVGAAGACPRWNGQDH